VKEANILAALGVPDGKADEYLIDLISKLTHECIGIAKPCAAYTIFSHPQFEKYSGQMELEGEVFAVERMVWSALRKSSEVAIFVATCGPEVELLSKKLIREGHPLEGLIVDLVGSEIAESVADFVHKKIEENVSVHKHRTTNRYSPGYCNWPVSDQQKLFELMGENTCGVNLTPSSLMLPIKSVSGIVGIGKQVQFRGYACSKCEAAQCIYRDKKK
jgi:hypothetical protein